MTVNEQEKRKKPASISSHLFAAIGIPAETDIVKTESLGLQLVHIQVEDQLEGEIELDRGTSFRIRFRT